MNQATTIKTRWLLWALLGAGACGPGPALIGVADEPMDDPTFESPDASDEGTGDVVDVPEPDTSNLCLEAQCPGDDDGGPGEVDAGADEVDAGVADAGAADGGHGDAGVHDAGVDAGHTGPVVGAKYLVRSYTAFRATASSTGTLLTAIAPHGGVRDSQHGSGQPLGWLAQGQVVSLAAVAPVNGFLHVRFENTLGWIPASRLAAIDTTVNPAVFAVRANVRNAFFKNQLHRALWNKDGAYYSGTCAPTSLAMAARIFGHEPAGLSIEESIHRARLSYGVTSDHLGTNRFQIRQGAHALGLSVAPLDTRLSQSAMLTRIGNQLAAKRVVVLEGQPGLPGPASTYQKAFNRAYARAGLSSTYTFDGNHSIAVIGRETDGGYVVGDPISEVGMVTLTGAELEDFFARWGGTGNAVW